VECGGGILSSHIMSRFFSRKKPKWHQKRGQKIPTNK